MKLHVVYKLLPGPTTESDSGPGPLRSRQTLTSPSDRVLCRMRIVHARSLSDTIHSVCPTVTSKSVFRTTEPDGESGH